MKSLIAWFVHNPVAANLMMMAMIVAGIFGYMSLEREFIPQTTVNGVTITMTWPGASPQDIEEQILSRIEEAVDGLDGIDYIESTAREGLGTVNIRTKLRIDYEKFLDQVKARVDSIQNLPQDAYRPQIARQELRAQIFFLALHGDVDRLTLQRAATDLRLELTKKPGLQLTEQITKIPEQVTIEISEDALQRYGLTFSQVAQAISGSSVNLSAGTVETAGGNLQLRTRSLANTKSEFDKIIVRQTPEGGTVRLGDIANVIDGFETDKFAAKYDGETAAFFQVSSPDRSDITESGKAVREFEKTINRTLPPALKFSIWLDMSTMFDSRMELIGRNAIQGMILVLIVLILFLRPAVAIWVTIGIASAFMGALAIAPLIGVTLNMISLFAFLLVIGIVVDDAIVVGESIYFHVENGITGDKASIGGANMVAKPVFFAVVTTIMMFLPFLFMTGPMQVIFAQISLVIIAVLSFSLIEAFFILPAHLRHLHTPDPNETNALYRLQNRIANSIVTFASTKFRPMVAWLMRYRYATFAVFVGLFIMAIGLLQAGIAPQAFLPEVEDDMISISARFPEGTTFERREQVREQVDRGIKELNANVNKDFGLDEPLIVAPGTLTNRRSVEGYLGLADAKLRTHISTKQIADKLEQYIGPIPDAYRVNYGTTTGPGGGGGGGVSYGVASSDTEALKVALLEIKHALEEYPGVLNAWDGLESSAQEIRFSLKPDAETLGITLSDVTRQVRQAFYGLEVQRLPRNGEDVRVMVRYPEAARESIDSLSQLRIRSAAGVEVPLYSIADISVGEGVGGINRRDRKRLEYTGARVRGDQEEASRIRRDMEENFFPQWVLRNPRVQRIEIGQDEIQTNFIREVQMFSIVILFLMYALLAIAFKSYSQPLLIMIAVPFAFVGMIIGNIVTGVPFGMMSIFGFFAAAGVAVNDNLVLIDYVNRLTSKGIGAYQSMLDACVSRFRPIMLTSLTTFVGITPILFETSMQAEFLKPMVVALAFGVLFDFFLTLMLVPCLYGIGIDIKRFVTGVWTGVKQAPLGSNYDPNIALALEDFEIQDFLDPDVAAVPAE